MKVFFDTNVYIAEALLGSAAELIVLTTRRIRWRVYASQYLLEETERVLVEQLGFQPRLAFLTRSRIERYARLVPIKR